MSRHGPDPERLFFGRLVGTARQLASEQGSIEEAIALIRALAGDHPDLLVQGAGLGVGAWSVNPGPPADILAAGLLVGSISRLELDVLLHWITVGQQRGLSGARYRA
jgi:hypothetical protein